MAVPKKISSRDAAGKLASLGFDPLEAQVEMYNKLLAEIAIQEGIAAGTIERLNKDGSTKAYNVAHHMAIVEKAALLAEKLSRYAYARVSESDNDKDRAPPVLNINLTDGEGNSKTFVLNGSDDGTITTPDPE